MNSIWSIPPVNPYSVVRGHYLIMLGYGKLMLEWRNSETGMLIDNNIPQLGLDGIE